MVCVYCNDDPNVHCYCRDVTPKMNKERIINAWKNGQSLPSKWCGVYIGPGGDESSICLDGDFTISELRQILEAIEANQPSSPDTAA